MKSRLFSSKKLITTGVIVALAAGGVTAALNQPASTGADTSPIVQQVNHNTDELANHEARITNTENDVKDLQSKTNTAPSVTTVEVPVVSQPATTQPVSDPTPTLTAPPAITVVKSQLVLPGTIANHDGDCHLTYSDDSYTFVQPLSATPQDCSSYLGQTK